MDCDDNLVYLASNPSKDPQPSASETEVPTEKHLGRWYFDRKNKKKKYIALNGDVTYGNQAAIQARLDKQHETRQLLKATRLELEYMMQNSIIYSSEFIGLPSAEQTSRESSPINYDKSKLESWGIPIRTVQRYENSGINKLFSWQTDCLCSQAGHALKGGNLVYSAPTSGGKTLVAELLILRRLGLRRGTVLFVVPYVALVAEKSTYFRDLWCDLGISVKAFHGEDDGNSTTLSSDIDVAVCTIERANIL